MKKSTLTAAAAKLTALAGLVVASAFTAQAQSTISIGPKGGYQYTNLIGASDLKAPFDRNAGNGVNDQVTADTKATSGFNAGIQVNWSTDMGFGLTVEALYSVKGAEFDDDQNREFKLSYIEVPILANWYFNPGSSVRPKVFVGPSVSYLLEANYKLDNKYDTKSDQIAGFEDQVNNIDVGVVVGAGANFMINDGKWLNLDVRYSPGLIDIYDENGTTFGTASVRNSVISVNAAFTFGL